MGIYVFVPLNQYIDSPTRTHTRAYFRYTDSAGHATNFSRKCNKNTLACATRIEGAWGGATPIHLN